MTDTEIGNLIRCMATCSVVMEYKLLQIGDHVDGPLRSRTKEAIYSCRRVQDYFNKNKNANEEVRKTFKEQFSSPEIVLLAELIELCFGIPEDGLEEIIRAVKQALENEKTENKALQEKG